MPDDTQDLDRPFGFWTAAALVMGGMIGAGVFILPAQLAVFGLTGVVGWLIAIAGALTLTWVCVGLSAAYPQSTGLIAVTAEPLGPLIGVVNGWGYWISCWMSVAVLGMSAASYLGQFVPSLALTPARVVATAIVIVWAFTLVNLAGARTAGAVQVVTTLLKLLPLVAVGLILAWLVAGGGAQFRLYPHAAFSAQALPSAVNLVFFALLGFEAAGIAAERVRNPARTIPRATLFAVALTGGLYLLVSTGVVFALPSDTLAKSGAPLALFVSTFWGQWAGLAVSAFAVIAAIGCLNGWVLIQGEVPLGMARAGLLPAWIGRTDLRGVPRRVVLLSSGLVTALLLLNVSRGTAGLFDFALRLTATTALFNYALFCVAALRLHVRPVAAVLGLLFSLWTIWGAGLEANAYSMALMLTAVPLYFLRPRAALAEQPA